MNQNSGRESTRSLVNTFIELTSNNEVHEVVLENSKYYGWEPVFSLINNPDISKKTWWALFNAELAEYGNRKTGLTRAYVNHNLDQDQLLALLSCNSGYRHDIFKKAGLPVVDEETAKIIIGSTWFDNQMKNDWLKTGTAPKALVDEYLSINGRLPEVVPRVIARKINEDDWFKLDPKDYELTFQQRYERINNGDVQSIIHNPEVHSYIEKTLASSGKQIWRLFIDLAQYWQGSIKGLVESCKVLLDA